MTLLYSVLHQRYLLLDSRLNRRVPYKRPIPCATSDDKQHAASDEVISPAIAIDAETKTQEVVWVETGREKLHFDSKGNWKTASAGSTETQQRRERLSDIITSVFLPSGFPRSVSNDYLSYQLWTLPTHATGWVSSSLATGSLLRAVGVGSGPVETTAAAAAIKWITKDGVGALGRLVVGGRLGLFIDNDPRLWRMAAEGIITIGFLLEIVTVFFPSNFLILAGTGNFTIAVAKGIAIPAVRVIQQHFARNNNIGEVTAKEESWGVTGQMTGILISVGILSALQDASSWQPVLAAWALFHSLHVSFRYRALRTLQFDSLNLVRATHLITDFLTTGSVTGTETVAREEQFMTDWMMKTPPIEFGCSMKDVMEDLTLEMPFTEWVEIFREERFLLCVKQDSAFVILKKQSTSVDCLKALWQFLWLRHYSITSPSITELHQSLDSTNLQFPEFQSQATRVGWDLNSVVFQVGPSRGIAL